MIVVDIFTKPDCHLCDRAKESLRKIRKDHPFELREQVLREDDPRSIEYGARVPVIVVNNTTRFDFRIPEAEFIDLLKSYEGSTR